jgi:uncharacterized protein (DUF4415 family)
MKKKKYDLSDYDDKPIDDPDNPEWTAQMFRQARPLREFPEVHRAIMEAVEDLRAKKRGRPKLEHPKIQVTLRLDEEVVNAFKEEGRGWQSKINDELRRTVRRRAKPRAAR